MIKVIHPFHKNWKEEKEMQATESLASFLSSFAATEKNFYSWMEPRL